jgi:agmatine/peptidylarginine deiminase
MTREPTEMEERVAAALYAVNDAKLAPHHRSPWPKCMAHVREEYIGLARAAIRAMRNPTDDVVMAAHNKTLESWDFMAPGVFPDAFNAMIDAASPREGE